MKGKGVRRDAEYEKEEGRIGDEAAENDREERHRKMTEIWIWKLNGPKTRKEKIKALMKMRAGYSAFPGQSLRSFIPTARSLKDSVS